MPNRWFATGLNWLWVAALVVLIDRFSKMWVLNHLVFFEPMRILPVFNLTLAYNTGAAFNFLHSMSGWQNWFLGGLAGVVSVGIVGWLMRISRRDWLLSLSLCLILGGALGNAWDRILYGYVIDFLSFHWGDWHFAIFNLADSAICVGTALLLWRWVVIDRKGL